MDYLSYVPYKDVHADKRLSPGRTRHRRRKVDDVDRVMAANSNNQNNPKNRNRENKVGNGSETLRVENSGEEEEEDDMDIGWTQIEGRYGKKASRKRKKGKEDASESSSLASEEEGVGEKAKLGFRIILRFKEETGVSGINPMMLTHELKKQVGEIAFAKVLQDGALMIVCKNEEQKNKAMKVKTVGKKVVTSSKIIGQNSWIFGVIKGVPIGVTMEELKKNLDGGKVIDAVRLKMNREGRRMDSLSVRIKFEGREMPDKVRMGFISYPVIEYNAPPMRCYNCQRYGHTAALCKSKIRCARCGGEHEFGKCEEGVEVKCCNCGGGHNAAYGGCEARKKGSGSSAGKRKKQSNLR